MSGSSFTHLHVHTAHSILDGAARLDDACRAVANDGQPALAITDHGTLSGAWRFAQTAAKHGIKPILGIELYLAVTRPDHVPTGCNHNTPVPAAMRTTDGPRPWGSRHQPATVVVPGDDFDADAGATETTSGTKVKAYEHLTVLAENATGWRNLLAVTNKAQETFSRKPLADLDLLGEHAEGLIVLTGCLGGPVASYIARGETRVAEENLGALVERHGRDNVFVEVMSHGLDVEDRIVVPELLRLADRFGLNVVATNDSHYTYDTDSAVHDAWLAVLVNRKLDDPTRFRFRGEGFHLRTAQQMRALFDDQPGTEQACNNTLLIAERVAGNVLPEATLRLPSFPVPDTYTPSIEASAAGHTGSTAYLYDRVYEGARTRYGNPLPEPVQERLAWELDVVTSMGLGDYFLIVEDMISFARSQGIRVGPGRGSAAGCALAYCLGITQIEPLAKGLLFERFLNVERAGMPDIDVDFEQGGQDRIMRYLADRWGRDNAARIGTYGVALARKSLRDVGRIMDCPTVGAELATAVPTGANGKAHSFNEMDDPENLAAAKFRDLAQSSDTHREVVKIARGFEGLLSSESIHACGVVVSDEPLTELIPLRKDRQTKSGTNGMWVTEWVGEDIDAFGLLKLDVLGLRNLDVVGACLRLVHETTGEDVSDLVDNPPQDPQDPRVQNVWRMLRDGRTAGVFQLESSGMTELVVRLAPTSLDDLAACVALYRPGPLGAGTHLRYVERKHGREPVDYGIFTDNPDEQKLLATVLDRTFGLVIYQEQMMQVGSVVAGFDAVWTNRLRKAVSKKKREEMEQVGGAFLDGAVANGFSRSTAERLWDAMASAADYAFNASHSYGYGHLAYVTAFLKANWPSQYAAALLSVTDKEDKRQLVLSSLRAEGIRVVHPNVNTGALATTVGVDGEVLLGLSEVKGVGSAEWIVKEREANGPFTSLADLLSRVKTGDGRNVPASDVAALIEAGALDEFGPRLGLMIALRAARDRTDTPVLNTEWGALERASRERARLGLLCSQHPLSTLGAQLMSWRDENGSAPERLHHLDQASDGDHVMTLGLLSAWTERSYSGGQMATFELEGSKATVRGVMWERDLSALASEGGIPRVGQVVAVRGQVKIVHSEPDESGATESRVELTARRIIPVRVDDPGLEPEWPKPTGPVPVVWGDTPEPTDPEDNDQPPRDNHPGPAHGVVQPALAGSGGWAAPRPGQGCWVEEPVPGEVRLCVDTASEVRNGSELRSQLPYTEWGALRKRFPGFDSFTLGVLTGRLVGSPVLSGTGGDRLTVQVVDRATQPTLEPAA